MQPPWAILPVQGAASALPLPAASGGRPPGSPQFKTPTLHPSAMALKTPHIVALALAGALLLGVRPAAGETLPAAAAAAACAARRRPLSSCGPPARSRCPSRPSVPLAALPAVYNGTLLLLTNSCGWAWTAVRTVPLPLHPLRAAMLNVTADYDQVKGEGGLAGLCIR